MSQAATQLSQRKPEGDALSSSPLTPPLADEVRRLVARLDSGQRMWLSGYLAGLGSAPVAERAPAQAPARPLVTILYGSQTGNAERVARQAAAVLDGRGIPHTLLDMADCGKQELLAAQNLLVVVSTQGEGDPPDRAVPLWELLNGRKAPQLAHVNYAVLGLGDSSYEKYCETGRQFDKRLEALGASRLHDRADCDVDFDAPARGWIEAVLGKLGPAAVASVETVAVTAHAPASIANAHTRKNPFHAEILINQRLTATGSSKDVRHIELSLEESNIHYEPGDALGIVPRNAPAVIDELMAALPFDREAPVSRDGQEIPLREYLQRCEVSLLSRTFLQRYADAIGNAELSARVSSAGDDNDVRDLLHDRELLDLVREHPPTGLDARAFAGLLRPLAPRLYSIASSQRALSDEVHLTVSVVEFQIRGRQRSGVVSGMLAGLTEEGATVPVYLHRNPAFRLPHPDTPVIMIGPGTGVAPFRAFVAEREALGARGRNWLFFGDRSFETDFLYQADWLAWRKQGVLNRIDVAFSRDQPQKIYVQHRLLEHGAEIWAWLAEGAYVYVCGDAKQMAPDVHAALLNIVSRHGGYTEERAVEYVTQLQRDRRYQRDVY
jgi:sulfite reductase (NADPH) flavoprotein alpha-component